MNLLGDKYKRYYYLLLGGLPVVLIIAWNLAFSQTFENYRKLNDINRDISQYYNAEQVLSSLRSQRDKLKNKELIKPQLVDETLLEIISESIGKFEVSLEEFPEIISENSSKYSIQTYAIRFSGRYTSLLKFLDFLEPKLTSGKVISVGFLRTEQRTTGEKLYMEIYYQLVFKSN